MRKPAQVMHPVKGGDRNLNTDLSPQSSFTKSSGASATFNMQRTQKERKKDCIDKQVEKQPILPKKNAKTIKTIFQRKIAKRKPDYN